MQIGFDLTINIPLVITLCGILFTVGRMTGTINAKLSQIVEIAKKVAQHEIALAELKIHTKFKQTHD